ncbi:hypothetical protein COCVIDRAFT_40473 [Bipolaris victoriae FI3]|uniref:Uncharacterized protein n=2 Tax=Bipolaris TaxID=33194 RepID=W6Y138_COCC2|nr:uncharacterized protein COCCADRAFT_95990 [Bipolaris zeicola 26-R-13]XP_014553524.1 hypothetical protein COCVIDRAFT_40473 [Bipolaris victoriae FI3]EUC33467.1 hypothetical protein COCCADRAFT_95990 [Bipolaris zeicola 26-R-13]
MEPSREPPWAEHEKVYLLAEVLKAAQVPSHLLFAFIRDANIQPRWNDMALPPGRSVRSSQMAFDTLAATYSVPGQDYRRPHLPAPMMYPGPEVPKKRPHQPETSTPVGRLLQPRPPHSYPGEYIPAGPAYPPAVHPPGEPTHKKKRGRPTKAEAQQRAQEAAARGEVYPPPRRGRQSLTGPPEQSPLGPDPRPLDRTTPPTTSSSQAPPVQTPQQQTGVEQGSESSSEKRRRARPQPLELEKLHTPTGMGSPLTYGSGDPSRNQAYSAFTPNSAPLPSSTEARDRDVRMEGVEETQARTTTPHSFKDTVGI